MKVWLYYLIDKTAIRDLNEMHLIAPTVCHGDPLYAYTTDRSIAKEFEHTRDRSKFMKKVLSMDKGEFQEFKERFMGFAEIDQDNLIVKKDPDKQEEVEFVRLPLTRMEHWCSVECKEELLNEIFMNLFLPIEIFSDSFKSILKSLRYPSYNPENGKYWNDDINTMSDSELYIHDYGWKNEFGIFLHFYNDLLDLKGIHEVAYGS